MPLVAANRIGTEPGKSGTELTFYGTSFIADATGDIVAQADRQSQSVLVHEFDLDALAEMRGFWGVFRDRRPELYAPVTTLDGQ